MILFQKICFVLHKLLKQPKRLHERIVMVILRDMTAIFAVSISKLIQLTYTFNYLCFQVIYKKQFQRR